MANLPNRFRALGPHEGGPQKVCFGNGYVWGEVSWKTNIHLALGSTGPVLMSETIGLLACDLSCCLTLTTYSLTAVWEFSMETLDDVTGGYN